VSAAIPLVVVIIVVFVIGEMLWVPTSQSVVAGLAPEDVRGAYMGAFSATGAVGFALAPFLGFQARAVYGDDGMWLMIAVVAVLAAVLGAIACRFALGRGQPLEAPAVT
jgi:dipeptide/tripeptide permease